MLVTDKHGKRGGKVEINLNETKTIHYPFESQLIKTDNDSREKLPRFSGRMHAC
jgi:hypothetical protein